MAKKPINPGASGATPDEPHANGASAAARADAAAAFGGAAEGEPIDQGSDRDQIVTAFMSLLAEKSFEQISLAQVATAAGVSLDTLRSEFSSTFAILAAFSKRIDRTVLAGGDGDMGEETARERLFDVLMRRLEALAPYRAALRSLTRSVRRNPGLALAVNPIAVRSQSWMLAAAGIDAAGPPGMLRAQGLAVLFARVMQTFVRDDDPGLARTMAALDRELARGQRAIGMVNDLMRFSPLRFLRRGLSRRRGRRYDRDLPDEDVLPI